MLGWVSTYPVDVAKTVIQSSTCNQTIYGTLNTIYRESGTSGWFRGLNATILRAFPTNVAILGTYHLTMSYLHKHEIIHVA